MLFKDIFCIEYVHIKERKKKRKGGRKEEGGGKEGEGKERK